MPKTTVNLLKDLYGPRVSRTYVNGVLNSENTDFPRTMRFVKVRSTVNTPNFRSLRKKWEGLPFNPFDYREETFSYPYGTQQQDWPLPKPNNTWHNTGVLVGAIDWSDADPITDSQKASIQAESLQKSLDSLKGMKVNLGVAFGERKRTSDLLLGTATRIASALGSLRKGNIPGVANALGLTVNQTSKSVTRAQRRGAKGASKSNVTRSIGNEWLALQYGWKPLLSDVHGAAEKLAELSGVRRTRMTASRSVHGFSATSVLWHHVPTSRVAQSRYTRKYIYVFSTSNEILKDLSSFGITNPAAVLWELLPWSFVLDWFIPIGNYIDTWDATLGLTFEKGCYTDFSKLRIKYKASGSQVYSSTLFQTHGAGFIEQVRCTRVKLNSFPLPRPPDWSPHITFNRGVSTLALLRQRLKL